MTSRWRTDPIISPRTPSVKADNRSRSTTPYDLDDLASGSLLRRAIKNTLYLSEAYANDTESSADEGLGPRKRVKR